jgi:serpin B
MIRIGSILKVLIKFQGNHALQKSCKQQEKITIHTEKNQQQHMINLTASNNKFGFKLLSEIAKEPVQGNVIISPLSIYTALMMTHLGSYGTTRQGMSQALQIQNVSNEDLKHPLKVDLVSSLDVAVKKQVLSIANAVFYQSGYPIEQSYKQLLKEIFNVENNEVDFVTQHEQVTNQINSWVNQATHQMIPTILPKNSLTTVTRVVLVNALFFNGKWITPFDKSDTTKETFTTLANTRIRVDMMKDYMIEDLPYGETKQYSWVEKQMKDDFSMFFILPSNPKATWDDLVQLTSILPVDLRKSLQYVTIENLWIPKFSTDYSTTLSVQLKALGMEDAFNSGADFGNMIKVDNDLKISEVYHKVRVEVSEEGVKAAAATAVIMDEECEMDEPTLKDFKLDRPFVTVIYHRGSGSVLFTGIITDPSN